MSVYCSILLDQPFPFSFHRTEKAGHEALESLRQSCGKRGPGCEKYLRAAVLSVHIL
jgi:hypothetical protein